MSRERRIMNNTLTKFWKKNLLFDLAASLLLVAVTVYYSFHLVDFNIPPFEDAAMLMRYADHLARGFGIVWNVGEAPVDGATDFLFMASSAALIKMGLTVGRAVRGLGYLSHIINVLLIYWVNRRLWGSNIYLALFSALYLAVGTGLAYVAAYFGTPFFALAASITWTLGLILILREKQSLLPSLAFALSGLITGLIRPEGAILALLMLAAIVLVRGIKRSMGILITFVLTFGVIGGAYFIWRWDYFGHPLPNPFYKKGAGALHWDSYQGSLLNTLRLCLPFLAAFILGWRSKETTRLSMAFLLPVIGFAILFILISDETNYGARFQYALVPIALLSWYPLVRSMRVKLLSYNHEVNAEPTGRERAVYYLVGAALAASLVYYSWAQNCFLTSTQPDCLTPYESDGRYDMGKLLANYRGKGYVLATTEAGLLPYYSGWTSIDTWGLNDPWIAQHGEITKEYLDLYKPQVIAFHAYYSPLVPAKLTEKNLKQDWFRMTITLKEYAEVNGYLLAAVFGDSPYDTHYYYVRDDFEDSEQLFNQISSMTRYYWPVTGKKSINYANYPEP